MRQNVTFIGYGGNPTYWTPDDADIDLSVRTNQDSPTDFGSYMDLYFKNGYVTLTDVVNTYIVSDACRRQNNCPRTSATSIYDSNNRVRNITNGFPFFTAGGVPFPSPEVTNAGFFALFGTIFPLLLIIGLLYPLANNVSQLVREKESKIREGMKMMSLRSEALWLSWWLHFLELYFPLAIILSLCASSLFQYSERLPHVSVLLLLSRFQHSLWNPRLCIFHKQSHGRNRQLFAIHRRLLHCRRD